jgi:hypothetical protein
MPEKIFLFSGIMNIDDIWNQVIAIVQELLEEMLAVCVY